MGTMNRRRFVGDSAKGAASLTAAATVLATSKKAVSANEKIVMATIGTGGRGQSLASGFAKWPEVEFAYLCDADRERDGMGKLADALENEKDRRPKIVQDYHQVLEDKEVDAVIVATNDHWHGPMAVFACQAGKDVYVEKPPSHNVWEGRKMVEAARKYKRIMQCGTQNRSAPYNLKALEYIRGGKLGDIVLCKVFNMKGGGPFHLGPDGEAPSSLNWDLWLGPAPMRPYNRSVHGSWKLFWDFTADDLADDGSHQLDLARMLIQKDFPTAVHSSGGTFPYNDDRETPVILETTYEFDDMVMTFELTQCTEYMAKTPFSIRNSDTFPHWPQNATRIEIYGTEGVMIVGRHGGGWQVFGTDGEVVAQEYGRFPDDPHKQNFLDCIRSRELPNADIEQGHRSACLIHLASVSYRVGGKKLRFDSERERFDDREANALLRREYREPYAIPGRI